MPLPFLQHNPYGSLRAVLIAAGMEMERELLDDLARAHAAGQDGARPEAVERIHARGRLTARERIGMLLDPQSMVELGALKGKTPSGWKHNLGGVDFLGTVDEQPVVASSTDYSHHGGGYGAGHLARLFALSKQQRWPVVLFSDGGGSQAQVLDPVREQLQGLHGRYQGTIGFFEALLELGGWVPSVAVVSGPSFAGHASLAASCDVIIATEGSSLGMGGPPMVEAAFGLRLTPTELAPVEMHERTGGIDLLVNDEVTAIAMVRRFLSFNRDHTSGPAPAGDGRHAIGQLVEPVGEYDMKPVIRALVDEDSGFELRPHFAPHLITALARLGGRAIGVLANQPASSLNGAIDEEAAGKLARFVQLCDILAVPILSLVDTPGFVVKDEADSGTRPGMSRHHARVLRALHHRHVPLLCVQIGRARGLGAAAMAGIGRAHSLPLLRLGWPAAELAGDNPYWFGLDDVIDPALTRDKLMQVLRLFGRPLPDERPKRVRDVW